MIFVSFEYKKNFFSPNRWSCPASLVMFVRILLFHINNKVCPMRCRFILSIVHFRFILHYTLVQWCVQSLKTPKVTGSIPGLLICIKKIVVWMSVLVGLPTVPRRVRQAVGPGSDHKYLISLLIVGNKTAKEACDQQWDVQAESLQTEYLYNISLIFAML